MSNRKQQRADRARLALAACGEYSPEELDAAISDLIADLMHLGEVSDLEFEYILHSAEFNYEDERLDFEATPHLPEYQEDADLPRHEEEDPNVKRANRGAKVVVLGGYRPEGLEWHSAIADLLKDLRHLADRKKVAFDVALEMSEGAYDMEIREDSLQEP